MRSPERAGNKERETHLRVHLETVLVRVRLLAASSSRSLGRVCGGSRESPPACGERPGANQCGARGHKRGHRDAARTQILIYDLNCMRGQHLRDDLTEKPKSLSPSRELIFLSTKNARMRACLRAHWLAMCMWSCKSALPPIKKRQVIVTLSCISFLSAPFSLFFLVLHGAQWMRIYCGRKM